MGDGGWVQPEELAELGEGWQPSEQPCAIDGCSFAADERLPVSIAVKLTRDASGALLAEPRMAETVLQIGFCPNHAQLVRAAGMVATVEDA